MSIGSGKFGDIFHDEEYLAFIRTHPCVVVGCRNTPIEADHLSARGWREAKNDDYTAVPFCRRHHRERQGHTLEWFETKYNVNLWKEAHEFTKVFLLTRIEKLERSA